MKWFWLTSSILLVCALVTTIVVWWYMQHLSTVATHETDTQARIAEN